jgi:hypothetical protein
MKIMEEQWTIIERPGYLGGKKEETEKRWNKMYGDGNWRISWVTATGEHLSYEHIFDIYIKSYAHYFDNHPDEVNYITDRFSYGYDLDFQTKEEAFDKYALYQKPGKRNQFHQVAFNIAIEKKLQKPFQGETPLQVRDAKPGTPQKERPLGWKWNPGRIPCIYPHLIPKDVELENMWWLENSIEDFYQKSKVLEVKN